jgi:coenzyme F420 hydrogenase subunit beta
VWHILLHESICIVGADSLSQTCDKGKDIVRSSFKRLFSRIVEKGFCVGCGTCVGACPSSALRMKETNAGYYIPVCDEVANCRGCEFCLDTCPALSMAIPSSTNSPLSLMSYETNAPPLGSVEEAYIGYAKDQRIRTNGSSGGITSAILVYALESGLIDGAIVVGMSKEQPWKPQVKIAKTREEIVEAAGSKYSVVPTNSILQSLRKVSGKFALVGLPCHIRGLHMIQQRGSPAITNKISFNIGLFCGLNFKTTGTDYLLSKIGIKDPYMIRKLEYRHGYPGRFCVRLTDGTFQVANASAILQLFRSETCTFCRDLTNEFADISVGDIYSLHSRDSVGVILTRTKVGEDILLKAKCNGYLRTFRIGKTQVVESQLTGLIYKKKGSIARKYLIDAKRQSSSFWHGNHNPRIPSSRQLTFEIMQHKMFFEGTNRFLIAMFKYLPLQLSTYVYGKVITLLFLLGKFFYGEEACQT